MTSVESLEDPRGRIVKTYPRLDVAIREFTFDAPQGIIPLVDAEMRVEHAGSTKETVKIDVGSRPTLTRTVAGLVTLGQPGAIVAGLGLQKTHVTLTSAA